MKEHELAYPQLTVNNMTEDFRRKIKHINLLIYFLIHRRLQLKEEPKQDHIQRNEITHSEMRNEKKSKKSTCSM